MCRNETEGIECECPSGWTGDYCEAGECDMVNDSAMGGLLCQGVARSVYFLEMLKFIITYYSNHGNEFDIFNYIFVPVVYNLHEESE